MSLRLELTARLLDLPGLVERKSKFSKAPAFFFGSREIAHFHSATQIDIRLTRPVIREMGFKGNTDWLERDFRRESQLAEIVKLVEKAIRANAPARD